MTGKKLIAALLALAAAIGGITIALTSGTDDSGKPTKTVTVTLGGQGQKTIVLTPKAQAVATVQAKQDAAGNEEAAHSDLRKEPAASLVPNVLQGNKALTPAGQPALPANPPLAAVHTPGCRTLLVRNFSSRQGAPILLFVIHFTVSTDSGWAGVLGNVKWFDSPAAQASSNYIIDRQIGACALVVAEASKAWAQAGFNRNALSVEVTARGTEGSLVTGAGRARLVGLMRRAHAVYKIPFRHGAVSGCSITRTGFVMHADLGACGGGHVDVRPYSIDPLIKEAGAGAAPVAHITSADQKRCRLVHAYRVRRHQGKPRTKAGTAAFNRRRATVKSHGGKCVGGKAVRR